MSEGEIDESSSDKGNPLLEALIASGLNLGDLGTVFEQLPQTLDTLQKFSSGGSENEKQTEDENENEGNQANPLLEALTASGLNLSELGTVFGHLPQILDALQMFSSGRNKHEKQTEDGNEGNQENPLLNALGSEGLNLNGLGTMLQRLPQIINTFQNLFSEGGLENVASILAALQEKVQEKTHSNLLTTPNTSPQPDSSEANENGVKNAEGKNKEHHEIPSEGAARDEL